MRLTQGGQHDTQLSAHDCAVALLVEDAQTLNVVLESGLVWAVDDGLEHGQETLEVYSLAGHVCMKGDRDDIQRWASQVGVRQKAPIILVITFSAPLI